MNKIKSLILNLNSADLLVVVYAFLLTIVNLIFADRVDNWATHVVANTLWSVSVVTIAYMDEHKPNIIWREIHYWYLVPTVVLSFKELYFMVKPIRQIDYDQLLINIDRFIFGFDPTVEMFKIANPILTEILQIAYGTFFFLPIILAVDLIFNDRMKEFRFTAFVIVLGFFLSYIGYIIVPGIGPRFTLHDFDATNLELPGIFFTKFLREIVNAAESIPAGTLNPAEVVQRDIFPSGHTQMTLLVMYLSVRFRTNTRYFLLPIGSLLIIATVYLRYHYVIDLIAGLVFMILTLWLGYYLFNWWMGVKRLSKFEYPEY